MTSPLRAIIALMAIGGITADAILPIAMAHAAPPKKARKKQSSAMDAFSLLNSGGGAPGCSNAGQVSANQAAILKRLGGRLCQPQPVRPVARDAAVPDTDEAVATTVRYQADGYTVYWREPGNCSLFLDTPRATVRVSYRADGTTNFSYVRQVSRWTHPRRLIRRCSSSTARRTR